MDWNPDYSWPVVDDATFTAAFATIDYRREAYEVILYFEYPRKRLLGFEERDGTKHLNPAYLESIQ
jgi:hypothetical protein